MVGEVTEVSQEFIPDDELLMIKDLLVQFAASINLSGPKGSYSDETVVVVFETEGQPAKVSTFCTKSRRFEMQRKRSSSEKRVIDEVDYLSRKKKTKRSSVDKSQKRGSEKWNQKHTRFDS